MKRFVWLASLFFIFLAENANARIWFVKADGSGEAATIQAAVDTCLSGDSVVAYPGLYSGAGNYDIDFKGKSIIALAYCRYDTTVTAGTSIDCEMAHFAAFYLHQNEDSSATIEGFIITNGFHVTGIICNGSSPRIKHNVISNCYAAIEISSSSAIIEDNSMTVPGFYGTGIECSSSMPTIRNNNIDLANCHSEGIICSDCPSASIAGNSIRGGGDETVCGIRIDQSTATVKNNVIGPCSAYSGYGIIASESNLTIFKNEIKGCYGAAYGGGGALICSNTRVVMDSNYVHGCGSELGLCIYISNAPFASIIGNSISSNSGGISISCDEGIISDNTISDNGLGAIYCHSSITIENNTIRGNNQYVDCGYSGYGDECVGGIGCYSCSPTIRDNLIVSNKCSAGGGIYCENASPVIEGNTIADNWAARGAGIYCDSESHPTLSNNIVASNKIRPCCGWEEEGGGIYCESPPMAISCSDVWGNEGGDYIGIPNQTALNGNISADPRFCDPASATFTLRTDSPCLPGNHPDDADCGLIGALGWGCPAPAPYISAIVDVKNDQGRQVSVSWQRSSWDTIGSATPILTYEIYRRIDDLPLASHNVADENGGIFAKACNPDLAYPPGDWHYLFEVPAHGENSYHAVAPTLEDSCVYSNTYPDYLSTYFVRATTAVPTTYFDSNPDSGYSVDNLSPLPPQGLAITRNNVLQWEENGEKDLAGYNVYAKESLESVNATLIGAVTLSEFDLSQSIRAGYHHWGVTAHDYNGNESDIGLVEWVPTGDDPIIPSVYSLMQNFPNPFNPTTTIQFNLPEKTKVTLSVFNANGQLVRVVADKTMEAGKWQFDWDGKDGQGRKVSSGIYFYRLATSNYNESRKMILLR